MAVLNTYVEVVIALMVLLLGIVYLRKKKDPRYPPGPTALPIVGNLLQLGGKPQTTLLTWAKRYGPVFSIKMGSEDVIVLNDHKIIKDVFQDPSSTGRTAGPVLQALGHGNHGLLMSEGAHWEQLRRFTLRKLRDFGFSKTAMESLILEEVNSMVKWFDKRLNKPISGKGMFGGAVVNSLWSIISRERQEWDRDEPPKMLEYSEDMFAAYNRMNSLGVFVFPFLRKISPDFFGWNKWINNIDALTALTSESVKRHTKALDESNPQDFIDHFLIEKKNTTDPSSCFYKEKGDMNLKVTLPDLFFAGSQTTSHTLEFAMLLLAHHQEIQKKLHEELDSVVGRSRQPSITDRPKLPYTEALIMELLRTTTVSTNGVPHRMTQDAVIHGYFFPKDISVMPNLTWVHNDPKIWGDPENFRPERFLSADGSKAVKHEALLPFSVGKRVCIGESLAKDSLLLFLTGIFQKFQVKPDPSDNGNAINNILPSSKLLNEPAPFRIIVSPRE